MVYLPSEVKSEESPPPSLRLLWTSGDVLWRTRICLQRYLRMHQIARTPSFQLIFFPSA